MKKISLNRRALTALPFLALLVAGCLASAGDGRVDRSDETVNGNALGLSSAHVMPLKTFSSGSLINTSAPSGAHLSYYGGPVLANVKVVTVFWGGSTKVNYSTQLNAFYTGVTNSAYFDWLSEYDTPSQNIGRGTFGGTFSYTNAPTGTIDDTQIQADLQSLITAKSVPAPDANTLYAIHFAPGITITQGGQKSCSYFCAYDGTISSGGSYIYYSVIPDQAARAPVAVATIPARSTTPLRCPRTR